MATLDEVVQQLREERAGVQAQIQALARAISALGGSIGRGSTQGAIRPQDYVL